MYKLSTKMHECDQRDDWVKEMWEKNGERIWIKNIL